MLEFVRWREISRRVAHRKDYSPVRFNAIEHAVPESGNEHASDTRIDFRRTLWPEPDAVNGNVEQISESCSKSGLLVLKPIERLLGVEQCSASENHPHQPDFRWRNLRMASSAGITSSGLARYSASRCSISFFSASLSVISCSSVSESQS